MINCKEIEFKNYGPCLCISNGSIELCVTLDFGPRICRLAFIDGENFMFEFEDINLPKPLGDDCLFDEKIFYNRGGHRFWLSPEVLPRTEYPDNKKVSYKLTPKGAVFIQEPQEVNGVQLFVEVCMCEDKDEVSIIHTAKNVGYWPIEFAPWAVSVNARGGVEVIPQNTNSNGLLPNRLISVWSYTDLKDPRIDIGNKYITLYQNSSLLEPFKIGVRQDDHPWAMFFHHGDLFIKSYDFKEGGKYPDNNCSFESYVCERYTEMETLGTLKTVGIGESHSHTEVWQLFKNIDIPKTENEIDELKERLSLK